MENLPHALVGEFVDAVVQDPKKADALLAEHPDLLNARWIHDETVLHFLAIEGFAEGVSFLSSHGADVNAVSEFGDSVLIDVAALGNDEIAGTLLRHGANPNAKSVTRNNALHAAVRSGNARLVALLLKSGADGRYRTDSDESVFDAVNELLPDQREGILTTLAEYGIVGEAG
jgi:ankyrin repeat protein